MMFDPTNLINDFPYIGIFALLILGAIGLPFPEDTTVMLCGFLVASDVVKPLPSFLVIYIGLLITDFSLYSVGKKYGRSVVEHRRFHRLISPEKLLILEEKFRKRGGAAKFIIVTKKGGMFTKGKEKAFLIENTPKIPKN